ncbi:MAG: DUF2269 family protein [Candidatus Sericytochromatia bacterium]
MLYLFFKYLHLLGAIGWIGGLITLSWINWNLSRESSRQTLQSLSRFAAGFGPRFVGPAALLTLLAGIATTRSGGLQFHQLWISLGFAAIALSILLGATLIRATTKQLSGLLATEAGHEQEITTTQRRLGSLNLLNLLILLAVAGVMVFKPV